MMILAEVGFLITGEWIHVIKKALRDALVSSAMTRAIVAILER
ncbi:hypothetical protein [Bdellovibrio sp.]